VDQGSPDLLDLFHEDAEFYFPKFGFGFGRESLFEMIKGYECILENIRHDYDGMLFLPSGDYVVAGEHQKAKWLASHGKEEKLPADAFAMYSNFEMAKYPACTFISIPIIPERMKHDSGGARIAHGSFLSRSPYHFCREA